MSNSVALGRALDSGWVARNAFNFSARFAKGSVSVNSTSSKSASSSTGAAVIFLLVIVDFGAFTSGRGRLVTGSFSTGVAAREVVGVGVSVGVGKRFGAVSVVSFSEGFVVSFTTRGRVSTGSEGEESTVCGTGSLVEPATLPALGDDEEPSSSWVAIPNFWATALTKT